MSTVLSNKICLNQHNYVLVEILLNKKVNFQIRNLIWGSECMCAYHVVEGT